MRPEISPNASSGSIHSISNVTDTLREEARKSFEEGGRRGFLQKSLGAAGMVLGGGAIAHAAGAKGKAVATASKVTVPTLPELYPGWNAMNFSQIRTDENAHVSFLVNALGSYARPMPTFKNLAQPDVVSFAKTSFAFENTGVGAYLAASPYIYNKAYLAAAASILTIEARHSGYLGVLFDYTTDLNLQSFDHPATIVQVILNVDPYFVSFNGGSALGFSTTPSPENDVAILNTALALEYLEQSFYNANVKTFFGV